MYDQTLVTLANAVIDHNRAGTVEVLLDTHYAPDCVSVEARQNEGMPREAAGLEAIRGKHAWWNDAMEMHGSEVEGPFLFDPDRFAVRFTIDATERSSGERMQGSEIGLYTVANGKIVREEFFWAPDEPQ